MTHACHGRRTLSFNRQRFRNKINQAQLSAQIMFLRFLRYNMKIWFSCGVIRGPHNNIPRQLRPEWVVLQIASVMHFFTWAKLLQGPQSRAGNVGVIPLSILACLPYCLVGGRNLCPLGLNRKAGGTSLGRYSTSPGQKSCQMSLMKHCRTTNQETRLQTNQSAD